MFKIFFDLNYGCSSFLNTLLEDLDPKNFYDPRILGPIPSFLSRINRNIQGESADGWIMLWLNGRLILGGRDSKAFNTWQLLIRLNNVLYQILHGEKSSKIFLFFDHENYTKKHYLLLDVEDYRVFITATSLIYVGGQQWIQPDHELVHLYQLVEESIRGIDEFRNTFFEAVKHISPNDLEEVKKCHFNSIKVDFSRTPWLPLEQAWSDYKKQHNITDEDVKKVIAEEEEKEKKTKKKWWQITI